MAFASGITRARAGVTGLPQRQAACRPFTAGVRRSAARHASRVAPAAASSDLVPDDGFSISKISFGDILLPAGVGLMVFGFGGYFQLIPGGSLSGVLLIYGFPVLLLGFALKYAQLEPVPCATTRAAYELRASQMTDIQKQVREDCTRYRYGDEQHLEEALQRVFMIGRPTGLSRRQCPRLTGLREEVIDGAYALVLEFENRNGMTEEQWMDRQDKFTAFFGPGLTATIECKGKDATEVVLRSDGSGAGIGGADRKDVLPPLAPGQKPRSQ